MGWVGWGEQQLEGGHLRQQLVEGGGRGLPKGPRCQARRCSKAAPAAAASAHGSSLSGWRSAVRSQLWRGFTRKCCGCVAGCRACCSCDTNFVGGAAAPAEFRGTVCTILACCVHVVPPLCGIRATPRCSHIHSPPPPPPLLFCPFSNVVSCTHAPLPRPLQTRTSHRTPACHPRLTHQKREAATAAVQSGTVDLSADPGRVSAVQQGNLALYSDVSSWGCGPRAAHSHPL
jgi:hypothetical protein